MDEKKPTGARPVYRYLAGGVAVVCLIAALLYGWGMPAGDNKSFGVGVFLFIGFVMATIAATGYWPRR